MIDRTKGALAAMRYLANKYETLHLKVNSEGATLKGIALFEDGNLYRVNTVYEWTKSQNYEDLPFKIADPSNSPVIEDTIPNFHRKD